MLPRCVVPADNATGHAAWVVREAERHEKPSGGIVLIMNSAAQIVKMMPLAIPCHVQNSPYNR